MDALYSHADRHSMRRSERLLGLMGLLRDGRLHRATDLAKRLNVSQRTIYRDMETLQASGIPVEGERGTGYLLAAPMTLPPLSLTLAELEALQLGIAVISEAADEELQRAAISLAAKIDAVVPDDQSAPAAGWNFAASHFSDAARGFAHMPTLRAAIRSRQKLRLSYIGRAETVSERTIRPLQLDYRGRIWILTAWCETQGDFKDFRVDRIQLLEALPELFVDERGRTLSDYYDRVPGG